MHSALLGTLLCAPVYAQNALWQALYEGAQKALEQGNLNQAEKQFGAALENADSDEKVIQTAGKMALVCDQEGKFPQARALYERVYSLDTKLHGKDSLEAAADLNNLGLVCQHGGKFSDAEDFFKQAIASFQKANKNFELAATLTNYALLMQETAKYAEVEPLLKQAITIYEKTGDQIALAGILDRYAAFCRLTSRNNEAEAIYSRALSLREAKTGQSPLVADTLCALGQLHSAAGEYTKAEAELSRALSIIKAKSDKVREADMTRALADCLSDQERQAEALKLYQKSLELLQTASGTTNTKVAEAMRSLAQCYLDGKDYVAAENLLIKALKTDEQSYGDLHPQLAVDLQTLGLAYLDQGKYAEAEPLYQKALALTEKTLGPQHPSTATSLNNLAWLYYNMGNYDQAEQLVERALKIRQEHFGENNPLTAQNLSIYAVILSAQHKFDKAEALLLRALTAEEEALGIDHPDISNNLKNLAVIYSSSGRNAEAEVTLRKLLSRDEKAFGNDSAAVASDLDALSAVLKNEHKDSERLPLLNRAQAIKAGLPGALGPNVVALPFNSLASQTSEIAEHARPVKDKWALVVGISNFRDQSINLKYAAKDATDFRNYLIANANFQPDHVRLLTDNQATRENIVGMLGEKWLRGMAGKDDLVCIYISSHGSAAKAEAGATNFVVPYDGNASNLLFTGIPMQWLTAGLRDLVHCDRLVVLLDVCHGGAATSTGNGGNSSGGNSNGSAAATIIKGTSSTDIAFGGKNLIGSDNLHNSTMTDGAKNIEREKNSRQGQVLVGAGEVAVGAGEVVMASSSASQISWESMHYPNGVFTRRLIEGLKLKGEKTTIDQAFAYMKERVEEEVLRDREQVQTPVIEKNWLGGDLSLSVPPSSPRTHKTVQRGSNKFKQTPSPTLRPAQGRAN